MSPADRVHPQQPTTEDGGGPAGRQSYEPPRILYREPLEVLAAVCTPAPPAKADPGACPDGPISS